jgi:hypothetical protein
MKVSTKSWHYRFMMNLYQCEEPKTLCGYFWKLMLCIFVSPVIFPLFVVVVLIFYALWPARWLRDKIQTWWYNRPVKVYEPKKEGVVRAYFRAAKSKVCPIIEYENPK